MGTRNRRSSLILLVIVVFALVATSCSSGGDVADPDDPQAGATATPDSSTTGGGTGEIRLATTGSTGPLAIRLSAGQGADAQEPEPITVAEGQTLSDARVQEILSRLPEWVADEQDQVDFNRPPESLPPPRTGETIESTFPAGFDLPVPEVPSGPLEVLRFQPDGEVEIAPVISITFNQPMVPLATLAQLDAEDVPARMTPELPGRWQWIGTRTLRFEHDSDTIDRLPMATSYTVEIPAGTTAQNGSELAEAVRWEFETPTVQVLELTPSNQHSGETGLDLEPVFVARFDQRVDATAVLETIRLEAGRDTVELRLATEEEIEESDAARRAVARSLEGRYVAFRAVDAFEPATPIRIDVGPNVPSAEGPRSSDAVSTFTANTYEPLRVRDQNCDPDDTRPCQPLSPLSMAFNNALDLDRFDETKLRIEPELPGAVISASGQSISIRGATAGRTDYEVTLPADLTDVWGQTLGREVTVTFRIGPAFPALAPFQRQLITTDPFADRPSVSVFSVNHDRLQVQAFAVEPEDWDQLREAQNELNRDDGPPRLPRNWRQVLDTTVNTDADDDQLAETVIDLSGALDGDTGHLVVLVQTETKFDQNDDFFWANRPTMAWVQVTDMAVDAFHDDDDVVVWATDLATGAPLGDVDVELVGAGARITTDADGLATTELRGRVDMVIARRGDDVAMLPDTHFRRENTADAAVWHVFDDRAMYRPGETVSVKGWVRKLTTASGAQVRPVDGPAELNWTARGPQGNDLATGSTTVSTLGGFDFTVDLPDNANLGFAWIDMSLGGNGALAGRSTGHQFQIQEFRRPEFEVSTRAETPGPYLRTEPATVAVEAAYFSGGPLPDAPVDWTVTTRDTQYSPPNWSDFVFGTWVPWWFEPHFGGRGGFAEDVAFEGDFFPEFDPGEVETFSGVTNANGTHFLQIDFDGDEMDQPITVDASAAVTDVNRQTWASSIPLLVHPADLYVGLRSDRTFVRQGDGMEISAIVVDIDGNVVPDRAFTVVANLLDWRVVDGEWQEVVAETQTCEVTSGSEPVSCRFDTDKGGRYQVTSTVIDDEGRGNRSEFTRWVSGGRARPNRQVEQEEVTLIPDKAEYADGETAEILVQAPFADGDGLLTIARNGIVSTQTFPLDDGSAVLSIPIDETDVPNLHVQVDVVGSTDRLADDGTPLADAPPRPAFAVGQLVLDVPPTQRVLEVTATPATDTAAPGDATSVEVTVLDADGSPVAGAEVAVVVVDEAVLALTDYQLRNPIDSFYGTIPAKLWSAYLRSSVVLDNPLLFAEGGDDDRGRLSAEAPAEEMAEGAADFAAEPEAAGANAGAQGAIDVRSNFDALAVFAPEVTTGADGTAIVDLDLPDNLTRYRVMAVAVDGAEQFGAGESNLTARLPLMVRPSAPRFLNFGDRFELPVVLQNQTGEAMDVDVVVETANLVLTDRTGATVTVPANDRIEVRFPATADEAGTARFRVTGVSGNNADSATLALPVYTPATAEAFATYGVVDDTGAVFQPVLAPTDVWPQFGGLEVNTSSTALQALTDAVIYISEYPYSSADAHASRILAIAALRDVLDAFDADGLPAPSELNETVLADLDAIAALQNGDGGFPIWRRFDVSWPYHTVHVTHALVEAQRNGYDVPTQTLNRALDYLRFIEDFYPNSYGARTRATISAYALHVRHLAGDTDTGKALALYRDTEPDDLTLEATAWLWPIVSGDAVIDNEIERLFLNRATETAGAATFATDYGEDAYLVLHSSRRTDGIILDALIAERPGSDLIPKVVTGLLGNQTRGRWNNMQENTFILLALNNYFDTFEAEDPDFVARIWLGDLYAAEHEYRGRSTDRNETMVPMAELIDQGDSDLVVAKDGADGRLYYRLGLRYAPADLDLDPLDRGFVVKRVYEGVDDVEDVWLDDEGNWHVKAGAEVRVRLTMVADSRRTHVALIDPLPAGLEVLNPALAVTPQVAPDPNPAEPSFWYWRWFGHQNLRDDRAEAFSTLVWAGTYEYTYVTRATTPGTFVTPPTRAEEMYAPETFGRSGTDIVIIED